MNPAWIGEFFGTMILILLGDGVVAGVLLKRSKAEGSGWIVITAGWAFAVMAGVFTAIACGSSDAHLNPAVTLGMAMRSGSFQKLLPYFVAQVLGAMAGATLVWLHYLPHWKETEDKALKLGCFCTSPGNSQRDHEPDERSHRHICFGICGGHDFFQGCGGERPGWRIGTLPGG